MPTALITGATGFIGSHLAQSLLEKGFSVRALVRAESSKEHLEGLPIDYLNGNYSDLASLQHAVKGVDIIYHVAGVTKALTEEKYIEGNVSATENLLNAVLLSNPNIDRFLHVSSGAAAGPSPSADNPINESAEPNPITLYGKSKLRSEQVCAAYFEKLPITIVRPSIIYGERDKDFLEHIKAINSGIMPIFGFVEKKYDYLYVKDLTEAIIVASTLSKTIGETYFLSGQAYSWQEMGEAVKKVLGKSFALQVVLPDWLSYAVASIIEDVNKSQGKISILNRDRARDGEQRYWTFSTKKAQQDFSFAPKTSLEEGLKATIAWYKKMKWV